MAERFAFLAGETVEQFWIWGPVRLIFGLGEQPEPGVYVDVHRWALTSADGQNADSDGSERPSVVAPVLDLLGHRVLEAAESQGVLVLRFDSGSELRALPDPLYESWTIRGPDGRVFQCMPGGEVDSW